jgi:hypothetical protein
LTAAYRLLTRAISALLEDQESESVRDSDVKRRMLAMDGGFDEGKLGFPKFSRFLRQAHDDEVVNLEKDEDGIYHLTLTPADGRAKAVSRPDPADTRRSTESAAEPEAVRSASSPLEGNAPAEGGFGGSAPRTAEETPVRESFWSRWLRPRDSSSRGAPDGEPPPLFEGQAVPGRGSAGSGASSAGAEGFSRGAEAPSSPVGSVPATPPAGPRPQEPVLDPASLHLPTERVSMIQYLTNSYGGVGERTAEALVSALGDDLFVVLQRDPSRVEALLPPARAEKVLEGWAADLERRRARHGGVPLVGSPEV